jgi:hypothetical protein
MPASRLIRWARLARSADGRFASRMMDVNDSGQGGMVTPINAFSVISLDSSACIYSKPRMNLFSKKASIKNYTAMLFAKAIAYTRYNLKLSLAAQYT